MLRTKMMQKDSCPSLVPVLDASIVSALIVHADSGRIVRYNAVAARMFDWSGLPGGSAEPSEEMLFSDFVSFYDTSKEEKAERQGGEEAASNEDGEPLLWQDVLAKMENGRLQLEGVGVMSSGDGFAVTVSMAKVGACTCSSCGGSPPHSSGDYLFIYAQQKGIVRRGSGRRLLWDCVVSSLRGGKMGVSFGSNSALQKFTLRMGEEKDSFVAFYVTLRPSRQGIRLRRIP